MANQIIMIDFNVEYTGGYLYNMFRAFVKHLIQLRMQNESSCSVTNDGSGFVKLNSFTDHSPVPGDVGEEIVIVGGDYQPAKGAITSQTAAPPDLITDIPYVSNATVRFFIKYKNLRMKYRFCEFTTLDDQSAANLFGSEFTFYPDKWGDLYIDISLVKSLLKPSFEALNDYNGDIVKAFQAQYQTAYDGNTDTWHSAHNTSLPSFEALVSIHATGRIAPIDYWTNVEASLDNEIDQRMWRGYDKIFTTLTQEFQTPNNITVQIFEYAATKAFIVSQTLVASTTAEDGLLISKLTSLNASTRYVMLRFTTGVGFITTDYDYYLTVYDTNEDENEFYITWLSDNGTIRQWLFTNKVMFDNQISYDILNNIQFRQIPNELNESYVLEAKGLSKLEREYISSLFLTNKIKIENNGEEVEGIISNPQWTFENHSNSYIVTIQLELKPMAMMNV